MQVMRILLIVLALLLILLQYKLWLGEGGFTNVQRLQQRVTEQQQENARLEQRNHQLEAEVQDLRQGYEAIEERARSELGMIREEEEFYQVVPGVDAKPQEPQEPQEPEEAE
jgi:cell division protein FtsB